MKETQDEQEIIVRVACRPGYRQSRIGVLRADTHPDPKSGSRRVQEITTYSTMTRSLQLMADRLLDLGVTRVVMEATSS